MAYEHDVISPVWQAVYQFVFNEKYTIEFIQKLIEQGFGVNYRVGVDEEKTALDIANERLAELQILSIKLQGKVDTEFLLEKVQAKITNLNYAASQ
jgi:hypothetical protein